MDPKKYQNLRQHFEAFCANWRLLSLYERFEQVVAIILSVLIALVIVVSLFQMIHVILRLILDSFTPIGHEVFQKVFGMIMTVLIAMEFKHSIIRVVSQHESIIQVKTVVLIALIALSRKFVILEPDTSPAKIAALAGAALSLGITYWLIRDRDDRDLRRNTN